MIEWLQDIESAKRRFESLAVTAARDERDVYAEGGRTAWCPCCNRRTAMRLVGEAGQWINLREALVCECGMNGRLRMACTALQTIGPQPRFLVFERLSPLFAWLQARYPFVEGCEYHGPGVIPGIERDVHGTPVRHEDMTALSYADETFSFLFHGDVLEHVDDRAAALRECHRVLRPGGTMLFTCPMTNLDEHIVRARKVDGRIEHLRPPAFHHDPLDPAGVLVYVEPGLALVKDIAAAGFGRVEIGLVYAPDFGILRDGNPHAAFSMWPVVFRATKLAPARATMVVPRARQDAVLRPRGRLEAERAREDLQHQYLACAPLVAGKVVLVAGCGTGEGAALLAPKARRVIGIDISSASVRLAGERHVDIPNLEFRTGDVCQTRLAAGSVDVVVCLGLLDTVDEPQALLESLLRLLGPEGQLLLSTRARATGPADARTGVLDALPAWLNEHFPGWRSMPQFRVQASALMADGAGGPLPQLVAGADGVAVPATAAVGTLFVASRGSPPPALPGSVLAAGRIDPWPELGEALDELQAADDLYRSARTELARSRQEAAEALQAERSAAESRQADDARQIAALQEALANERAARTQFEQQAGSLAAELDASRQARVTAEADWAERQRQDAQRLQSLEAELAAGQETLARAETGRAALQTALDDLQQEHATLRGLLEETRSAMALAAQEAGRTVAALHQAQAEALARRDAEQAAALTTLRTEQQEAVAVLQAGHAEALAALAARHDTEVASLRARHAEATAQRDAEHAETVAQLEASHAEAVAALALQRQALETSALQQEAALCEQLADAAARLGRTEAILHQTRQDLEDRKSAVARLDAGLSALQQQLDDTLARAEASAQRASLAEATAAGLDQDLARERATTRRLEELRLEADARYRARAESFVSGLQAMESRLEQERHRHEQRLAALASSAETTAGSLVRLAERLAAGRRQRDRLRPEEAAGQLLRLASVLQQDADEGLSRASARLDGPPATGPRTVSVPQLLALDDQAFIDEAYRAVLGRDPDEAGARHYAEALKRHTPRLRVLSDLRWSPEGREHPAKIALLDATLAEWRRSRLPLIGRRHQGRLASMLASQALPALGLGPDRDAARLQRIEMSIRELAYGSSRLAEAVPLAVALGRLPPRAGVDAWSLAQQLVLEEPAGFVERIFGTLLGRPGSDTERARALELLKSGASRWFVLSHVIDAALRPHPGASAAPAIDFDDGHAG